LLEVHGQAINRLPFFQKLNFQKMCKTSPIKFFQQIEIPVPVGAGAKVMIPDQPQLRIQKGQMINVHKIELYTVNVSAVSPNGTANAPNAEVLKMSLVLYVGGEEKIFRVPMFALNEINDGTNPFKQYVEEFDSLQVDFAKSYIQFSSAPANTPYVVLLGIKYSRLLQS
jgi:hypothetical protein